METGKVLVFGDGFLGTILAEYFHGECCTTNITDLAAVRAQIAEFKPSLIINAAAITATADLEKPENQPEGYRVNVEGAANLALAAFEQGLLMVHISTAMMFDGAGKDGQGIGEDEVPQPRSFYALTKAWADAQLIPLMQENVLIVRIHTPISHKNSPKNLLTKMKGWGQAVDGQSSVTVVEDLLPALAQLIERQARGIYNVVNEGSLSFYEIAQIMQEQGMIESDKKIGRVSVEDFQAGVEEKGGSYQPFPILSIEKLKGAGVSMRPVREAIASTVKEYLS